MGKPSFEEFRFVYQKLVRFVTEQTSTHAWQQERDFSGEDLTFGEKILTLICAFNRSLFGPTHPQYEQAKTYLQKHHEPEFVENLARFLRRGLDAIQEEISDALTDNPDFVRRLDSAYRQLKNANDTLKPESLTELFWRVFFPEGNEILQNKKSAEEQLRKRRKVRINAAAKQPIENPAKEILFTSNVLLTVPLKEWDIDTLPVNRHIKQVLLENRQQPQNYWYDHPIPVGIAPEKNEILYGLQGLNRMMAFEKERGNVKKKQKLTVVLSCSVTHSFLQQIAKEYVHETIRDFGGFEHLDVYLFTEQDVSDWLSIFWDGQAKQAIGVDGPYGRHYSFLKAIAAWWQLFVDPNKKATFKIDLDQVFDEEKLLAETGQSALEHFKTTLWGADGTDADKRPIHLGMIAGALVNATDIQKSLFTPDVPYPDGPEHADEFVFFSRLPQALSTEAEMMTRYDSPELDGRTACLQRVHVTGGTNGILIEALRRFKPFTPSFIGRAEDQAYLLSTMTGQEPQLGYLHKAGLIMRHDKDLFAGEAIKAAEIGKMIGDYERVLYFSAYARLLGQGDFRKIKHRVDPFTGCFISGIPVTVVYLRFVLRLRELLQSGRFDEAKEWTRIGVDRLNKAFDFVKGQNSALSLQFEKERHEWDVYYQRLEAWEEEIEKNSPEAQRVLEKARKFVNEIRVGEY